MPEFDAIVIGSGITGGWAAKELCEKGLKVLVLDRGKVITPEKDFTTALIPPWQIHLRGLPDRQVWETNPYDVTRPNACSSGWHGLTPGYFLVSTC